MDKANNAYKIKNFRKNQPPKKDHHTFPSSYSLGLSLLELLVAMSIVIILTGISIPSLNSFIQKTQADSAQFKLKRAIYSARNLAITHGEVATLCPDEKCNGDWSNGYILFIDKNNNALLDDSEFVYQYHKNNPKTSISWKGSGGVNYLKFSSTGVARQFGRFHLCPKKNDGNEALNLEFARAMVLNRQGRLRIYKDIDSNGIVEDIDGSEPDCI